MTKRVKATEGKAPGQPCPRLRLMHWGLRTRAQPLCTLFPTWEKGGRGDKPCRRLSPVGPNLVSGHECLALILHPVPTVCSATHPPDANSWVQRLCTLEACWPGGVDRGSLSRITRCSPSVSLSPSPHPHSQPPARGGSVVLTVPGSGTPPLCRCPGTGVRLFRELAAPLGLSRESWRERWKPTGVSLSGRGRWQRARTGL